MSAGNVEIVRRLIEDWNQGDYSASLASIGEEIELDVSIGTELDDTYRGHSGLDAGLRAFWSQFDGGRVEIEEAISAGSDVVLHVRFHGRGRRSGVEAEMHVWHVWTLREGKAVRWVVRRTRQEVLDAAGLAE